MKQDWNIKIFKADRRCARGEREVSVTLWTYRDEAAIKREVSELVDLYPKALGYRIIYYPANKVVKNLMTGEEVTIPTDTPRACDPSSELYWSM